MSPKTLYEQKPEIWRKIEDAGFTNCAAMARRFMRSSDMDRAMGKGNSTSRWHRGEGFPRYDSEQAAGEFLNFQALRKAQNESRKPEPEIQVTGTPITEDDFQAAFGYVVESMTVQPQPVPQLEPMLMVVPAPGTMMKVRRVLALLGAEVEEI